MNLVHPSCSPALVINRNGQRFSLISCTDYQATIASQVAQTSQRESASSNQIFGFHVVCGECDGFVVRNGILRNCGHQRNSSSSLLEISRKTGREAADESGSLATNGMLITVGSPAPGTSPELDAGGQFEDLALSHSENAFAGQYGRSTRSEPQESDIAVPRLDHTRPALRSSASVTSNSRHPATATANETADLALSVGSIARGERLYSNNVAREDLGCHEDTMAETENSAQNDNADQPPCDSETLMQDWLEWSEKLKASLSCDEDVIAETGISVDSDAAGRPHCDPDALMRDWREWSERWERLVKSR